MVFHKRQGEGLYGGILPQNINIGLGGGDIEDLVISEEPEKEQITK